MEMERHTDRKLCSVCKKTYIRVREEQLAKYRDVDYEICPYCQAVNGYSFGWDFDTKKLESQN